MSLRHAGRALLVCAVSVCAALAAVSCSSAWAADSAASRTKASDPPANGLFAAIAAGDLQAIAIPRDSKQLTLQLKNLRDKPLVIELPAAFAAAPVQAQIGGGMMGGGMMGGGMMGGGMMGGGMMGGGMMGGNQSLGVNGNAGNAGNRRNGRNGGGRPLFNIPAGKVVKVKLSCVCLEHGKAEPNPRIRYEVLPLSAVNQNVGVAAVVESLGRADMEQRVAQLAAWNLANGKTWRELATMQIKHVDGESEPLYTAAEIAHARELVEELQADAPAAAPSSTSAPAVR